MKGKVTISRGSDDVVRISIEDDSSRIEFVEASMSLEDFASAVLNLANRDCTFELRGIRNVGKTREYKKEKIFVPRPGRSYGTPTDEEMNEALKPHEVDGWMGSRYDLKNSKNYINATRTDEGVYANIGFVRYMDSRDLGATVPTGDD